MNIDQFKSYLDEIHAKDIFDYENEEVKNTIVECMEFAGRRGENYIKIFKRILAKIKGGAEYNDYKYKKDGKQANLQVDVIKHNGKICELNMVLFFMPRIVEKNRKKIKRYEIYGIEILDRNTRKIIFPPVEISEQ